MFRPIATAAALPPRRNRRRLERHGTTGGRTLQRFIDKFALNLSLYERNYLDTNINSFIAYRKHEEELLTASTRKKVEKAVFQPAISTTD
jgi:hypothetical protein